MKKKESRKSVRVFNVVAGITIFFLGFILMDKISGKPLISDYDVIVVGGEPEGVAAAVSAARNGARVLLIEHRDALGGLFTYGELNYLDIPLDHQGNVTSAGIFKEWWEKVGRKSIFDIDKAKEAFMGMVENEENLSLSLSTRVKDVDVENGNIKAVTVVKGNDTYEYTADRYIDATADGDFATLAGVPYTIGQEDIGKKNELMSVTLMIHLKNVDWRRVKEVAEKGIFGPAEATDEAAWGFWKIEELYKEKQEGVNLRGLNIGRTSNHDVYINALQIFGVNGLDNNSKKAAIEKGKKETNYIVSFLRENFPGFEEADIASYPKELYIRETRHMNTLYRVTASDLWEHRIPYDTIAIGGYPVDVQATSPYNKNLILFNPSHYGIPFRSQVPINIKNLLITSKASGYDSIPAGSIRVVPTGMSVAEAGGLAASISIQEGVNFHELSKDKKLITQLQDSLRKQGAFLKRYGDTTYPYQEDPDYESFKKIYSIGLLEAGYENKISLVNTLTIQEFDYWLSSALKQLDSMEGIKKLDQWKAQFKGSEEMTSVKLIKLIELFPELREKDISWLKTQNDIITYREGYRALALWLPPVK